RGRAADRRPVLSAMRLGYGGAETRTGRRLTLTRREGSNVHAPPTGQLAFIPIRLRGGCAHPHGLRSQLHGRRWLGRQRGRGGNERYRRYGRRGRDERYRRYDRRGGDERRR